MRILFSLMLVFFTTISSASTIETEIKKAEKMLTLKINGGSLKKKPDTYFYTKDFKQIQLVDLAQNGQQDAVGLFRFCEETNCHQTTQESYIVVFKKQNDGSFTILDHFRVSGFNPIMYARENGNVYIGSSGYADDDPSCCPSLKLHQLMKYKNGKITVSNKYD